MIQALTTIWEAAGYPWSVRLQAVLPLWLPWATLPRGPGTYALEDHHSAADTPAPWLLRAAGLTGTIASRRRASSPYQRATVH